MTRQEVFDIINSERDYQEHCWPKSQALPTPGEIILIEDYIRQWKEHYQKDDDAPNCSAPPACLHDLRKIAALAVRALENVDSAFVPLLTRPKKNIIGQDID
jgi:hypothetical protein